MNKAARVTKNTFLLMLSSLVDIVFSLISVAIVARYLGVEVYGEYAFILSIVTILATIPEFGFRRIIIREVVKEKESANHYLGSLLILRCFLSVVAFLILEIIIGLLGLTGKYIIATHIIMASELAFLFTMSFMYIFFAFEKMHYDPFLKLINRLIGITLILGVVLLDLGFIPLLLAFFVPNLLSLFIGYLLIVKKVGSPKFELNQERLKFLIKESYPLFIEWIFKQNTLRVDIFVLKAIRTVSEISFFYAPYSLILRLQIIPKNLITALFPSFVHFADTSEISFKILFIRVFKFLFILSLPIAVAITILADNLIVIIYGVEFIEASIALKILIWTVILTFIDPIISTALVAINKQFFSAIVQSVTFIVNLLIDVLLVPFYGFRGACIGTVIAYLIRFLLSYWYLSGKGLRLPLSEILPKPLLSGTIMGITMYLCRELHIIITLFSGAVVYSGAIILTGTFTKEEIILIKRATNINR